MRVVRNELVIPVDVDKTLILPEETDTPFALIAFDDPYSGRLVYRRPHMPHVRLLKNYLARGAFVIVWSKNGNRWAEAALKALGIPKHKNLQVMSKPFVYLDDRPCEEWMGPREYIEPNDEFGRE